MQQKMIGFKDLYCKKKKNNYNVLDSFASLSEETGTIIQIVS